MLSDREIIDHLTKNDEEVIRWFFFERCRSTLTYIGQFYCPKRASAEELIGEFYLYLSRDDWHKLRIFRFGASLLTYIAVIAARYFQQQRDTPTEPLPKDTTHDTPSIAASDYVFFRRDVELIIGGMKPMDALILRRLLLEGQRARDVVDEVRELFAGTHPESPPADDRHFEDYIHTRYTRARNALRKTLRAMGYN